jgi:hypothetical protein
MEIKERLLSSVKINEKTNCWEWIKCKYSNTKEYGGIKYKGKKYSTHRLSYMIFNNVELNDPNIYVCHKCDNPICINPEHLFIGTHSDNMKDAYKKGRIKLPENLNNRFKLNHVPANSKVSKTIAFEIRNIINIRRLNNEKLNLKQLSIDYNIAYGTIRDISCNKVYKN